MKSTDEFSRRPLLLDKDKAKGGALPSRVAQASHSSIAPESSREEREGKAKQTGTTADSFIGDQSDQGTAASHSKTDKGVRGEAKGGSEDLWTLQEGEDSTGSRLAKFDGASFSQNVLEAWGVESEISIGSKTVVGGGRSSKEETENQVKLQERSIHQIETMHSAVSTGGRKEKNIDIEQSSTKLNRENGRGSRVADLDKPLHGQSLQRTGSNYSEYEKNFDHREKSPKRQQKWGVVKILSSVSGKLGGPSSEKIGEKSTDKSAGKRGHFGNVKSDAYISKAFSFGKVATSILKKTQSEKALNVSKISLAQQKVHIKREGKRPSYDFVVARPAWATTTSVLEGFDNKQYSASPAASDLSQQTRSLSSQSKRSNLVQMASSTSTIRPDKFVKSISNENIPSRLPSRPETSMATVSKISKTWKATSGLDHSHKKSKQKNAATHDVNFSANVLRRCFQSVSAQRSYFQDSSSKGDSVKTSTSLLYDKVPAQQGNGKWGDGDAHYSVRPQLFAGRREVMNESVELDTLLPLINLVGTRDRKILMARAKSSVSLKLHGDADIEASLRGAVMRKSESSDIPPQDIITHEGQLFPWLNQYAGIRSSGAKRNRNKSMPCRAQRKMQWSYRVKSGTRAVSTREIPNKFNRSRSTCLWRCKTRLSSRVSTRMSSSSSKSPQSQKKSSCESPIPTARKLIEKCLKAAEMAWTNSRKDLVQQSDEQTLQALYQLKKHCRQTLSASRQMKTINYQLSSQKCLDEGWTLRAPSPMEPDGTDVFTPDPLNPDISPALLSERPLIEKYYEDGRKFLTIFPNGTGSVFYPSGNVAITISSVRLGHFTYVVQEDDQLFPHVRASFCADGSGFCYYANGSVRLSYDQLGGIELDTQGGKKRRWKWWEVEPHIHAPPFQPICFSLNQTLGVRIMSHNYMTLTFLAKQRSCRFHVGTRMQVSKAKLQVPPTPNEHQLFLKKKKSNVESILAKISTLLRYPRSPKLDGILPPIRLSKEKLGTQRTTSVAGKSDRSRSKASSSVPVVTVN